MKFKKTSKLFFDKYTLKVAVNTILAGSFRDNQLDHVESILEFYKGKFKDPKVQSVPHYVWSGRKVTRIDFDTCNAVYNILKNEKDYQLRIETNCINIYSNNESFIDKITASVKGQVYYISKPVSEKVRDYLLNSKFKIIANSKPEFKYKVTINPLRDDVDSFMDWGNSMTGKVRLLSAPKYSEGYFYALDSKVVTLCRLFLGSKIRRVDELVHESEI